MTQASVEHRQFHRVPFQAPAVLTSDCQKWRTEIIDLSLKGVLLNVPQSWNGDIGDIFQLEMNLSDEVGVHMEIKLVHKQQQTIGFHCEHIDLESMTILRRIIELNLGDTSLLDRDIAALGHDA